MIIRITNRCPKAATNKDTRPAMLQCFHCVFQKTIAPVDLDLNKLEAFMSGAVSGIAPVDTITLVGGEPTMHPQFMEVVKMILNTAPYQHVRIIHTPTEGTERVLDAIRLNTSRVSANISYAPCYNRVLAKNMPGWEPSCDGDFAIQPNGDITVCSCPDSLVVGNLVDGIDSDVYDLVQEIYDSGEILCINSDKAARADVERLLKEVSCGCK